MSSLKDQMAERKELRKNHQTKETRKGRPSKKKVLSKTRGNRNVIGRPKGDAAIMNEYKARMLSSPKSRKVLDAIFEAALDNSHKNQAAAWKLVMDRVLPTGMFEKDVIKDSSKAAIQINITGIGDAKVEENIIEAEEAEIIKE